MSNDVTIAIGIDDTQAQREMDEVQARADEITKNWAVQRNTILRQVREGFTLISSLMSSARQAFALFGQQIDPFFSALIGVVISTTSMLISAATTLTGTGIGAAMGAVVLGLAIGFNILTTAKLIADQKDIMAAVSDMIANTKPPTTPQGMVRF